MLRTYLGDDPVMRAAGTRAATTAARGGRLVVAPADSHYALITDAFSVAGVDRMREIREIAANTAIPVFIHRRATLQALLRNIPEAVHGLVKAFWPGPLTLIGQPQISLAWNAGTQDAVAVRMPLHPWMLDLIDTLGPVAATGAHAAGQAAATELAGCSVEGVAVALDAGELPGGAVSTAVDIRGERPVVVREGAISEAEIMAILTPTLPR